MFPRMRTLRWGGRQEPSFLLVIVLPNTFGQVKTLFASIGSVHFADSFLLVRMCITLSVLWRCKEGLRFCGLSPIWRIMPLLRVPIPRRRNRLSFHPISCGALLTPPRFLITRWIPGESPARPVFRHICNPTLRSRPKDHKFHTHLEEKILKVSRMMSQLSRLL